MQQHLQAQQLNGAESGGGLHAGAQAHPGGAGQADEGGISWQRQKRLQSSTFRAFLRACVYIHTLKTNEAKGPWGEGGAPQVLLDLNCFLAATALG